MKPLLYADDDDYLAGTVPFVEEGLAGGEPVLVAVPQERLELLRGALPTSHPLLQMADMGAMGRNPARIIPVWADFALPLLADGPDPVRGIGEPVWPGRTDDELTECAWHESADQHRLRRRRRAQLLLSLRHGAGSTRRSSTRLTRTHPHAGPPNAIEPSPSYRTEVARAPTCRCRPSPRAPSGCLRRRRTTSELRRRMRGAATASRARRDTVDDAVLAVNEAVVNTVRHAGGEGRLCTWTEG